MIKKPAKPVKKPVLSVKKGKKQASKSVDAQKVAPTPAPRGLTPRQQRFVEEYVVDLNGTQAAVRAGYSAKTAQEQASRLLSLVIVRQAVEKATQERSERTGITADRAIQEAWAMATADSRELMEYRVGCCRFCFGVGHRYQFTNAEFERAEEECAAAAEKAIEQNKEVKPFDPKGGPGYDRSLDPNKKCPECVGEGIGRTVFKDTRNVSAAAASLFAGVKETKEGLEIKLHSKDASLDKVFRHLGLYNDKLQLNTPLVTIKDLTGRKDA